MYKVEGIYCRHSLKWYISHNRCHLKRSMEETFCLEIFHHPKITVAPFQIIVTPMFWPTSIKEAMKIITYFCLQLDKVKV